MKNIIQRFPRSLTLVAAAAALLTSLPVHAVKYGEVPSTAPGAPAVVNPFSGQTTDVWKLVGYLGCSGFQITREWAIHAGHCGIPSDQSRTFSNHLGSSLVLGSKCVRQGTYDFQLCRLENPAGLTALPQYPALSVVPSFTLDTASRFGSLMAYGRSNIGDGLAFIGFNGLPYNYTPAAPTSPQVPFPVSGDSGGAAFWFSPTSPAPVIVGVLVGGTTLNNSPLYFNQSNLDFIRDTIVAAGDPAPVLRTTAQNFTDPGGIQAPELAQPPLLSISASSGSVQWTTPAATPAVSSFEVTLGRDGVLERRLTVQANQGNTSSFTGLAPGKYTACVLPRNAVGPANAAQIRLNVTTNPWYIVLTKTPNCASVDARVPQSTVSGVTAAKSTVSSELSKASFSWPAATPLPADMVISRYRLAQTITYPTGPKRTGTADVAATTGSFTVPKGSKVCVTVAALSQGGQAGPQSAQTCIVAD